MTEPSKANRWVGYVLSALPVLLMALSSIMKLSRQPMVVEGFAKSGMSTALVVAIGSIELICVLIYLVPSTSVLGAVLITGYMGGAVMVHLRAQEATAIVPFLLGVFAWGGLYLRDPRIRELLPIRSRRRATSGAPRAQ